MLAYQARVNTILLMSAAVHPVNFVPQKFLDTSDGLVSFHGIVSGENDIFLFLLHHWEGNGRNENSVLPFEF